MRVLLRFPKLPRELLKGSFARQDWPLPVSTLQPGRLQSLGEFWQALGGKPKAALNYTVTLPVDVSEQDRQPLVIDKEIRMRFDTQAAS
jgi:Pvc16 N-terminal domain